MSSSCSRRQSVACSGNGGGPVSSDPTLTGYWRGTAEYHTVSFSARFQQDGSSITGQGRFSSPVAGGRFSASGTVVGGDVTLTLTSSEIGTATCSGHFVAADRVTGRLDAPGRSGIDLTIDRTAQPIWVP